MDVFWIVIEFILCAIEVGIMVMFYTRMMETDSKFNRVHLFLGAALVTILITISTVIKLFSTWKSVFVVVLCTIYAILFFRAQLYKKVINAVLYLLLIAISDILAMIIVTGFNSVVNWNVTLQQDINRIAVYCIAKIVLILIATLITRFGIKFDVKLPLKYWIIFLTSFSIILIVVVVFMDLGLSLQKNLSLNPIMMILMLTLLFVYFAIYYLFYQLCNYFINLNRLNILQYQNESIQNYVIQKEETDKIVRILSHDLKHVLTSLREYAENKDFDKMRVIIDEYENIFEDNKLIDVGNNIANAILNQKFLVARNNNIDIEIKGGIQKDIKMTQIDLCALIGNTLDNALEATMKVEVREKRVIKINMKREGCFLFYEVENYYKEEPIVKNKIFISMKEHKDNHGIGMISINNIVSKYEGSYENVYSDNVFKTYIMLRAYDSN